jgi:hypothetical protein
MVLLKRNVNKNSVVTYNGTLRLLLLQTNLQDPIGSKNLHRLYVSLQR